LGNGAPRRPTLAKRGRFDLADDGTIPDDEVDIALRSPSAAAARTIVLGTVCRRAFIEDRPGEFGDDDPDAARFDLLAWLLAEGLGGAISPSERHLLTAHAGALEPDQAAAASWATEALVAIGWALWLLDPIPGYECPADPAPLLMLLPAPWDGTIAFCQSSSLRAEDAVAFERERAELWDWRAGVAESIDSASPAARRDAAMAIRDVAHEGHAAGLLPAPIGDDFPLGDRAFGDRSAETIGTVGSIARERLRALDWLCGLTDTWDPP